MKANRAHLTGEVSDALASYMHEKTEQSLTPQVDFLYVSAAHLTEMWLGRTPNTPSTQNPVLVLGPRRDGGSYGRIQVRPQHGLDPGRGTDLDGSS